MASRNIYAPLKASWGQFRIMRLLPGSMTEQISCELFIDVLPTDADSIAKPEYEALSYEWGLSDGRSHEILLSGQPHVIRHNLFKALLGLRKKKEERKLWVDAICIDQMNVQERNHQVERMSDIYRSAGCVHVWLGEGGCGNTTGTGFHDKRFWHIMRALSLSSSDRTRRRVFGLIAMNESFWAAVAALFERTYWSRMWIVQEFILAQEILIHYESHVISELDFNNLTAVVVKILRESGTGPNGIFATTNSHLLRLANSPGWKISRFREHYRKRTLIELLETCRNSKSSDAHDRVYAILGLADDVPPDATPIDYGRSIFKVKMDVAWFIKKSWDMRECRCPKLVSFWMRFLLIAMRKMSSMVDGQSLAPLD